MRKLVYKQFLVFNKYRASEWFSNKQANKQNKKNQLPKPLRLFHCERGIEFKLQNSLFLSEKGKKKVQEI